ncbi:MAG: butyrate kinase [Rikenellaceae bacterium]
MSTKNILAINPGSTSTKIALFALDTLEVVFEHTLRHSSEEIGKFHHIIDQIDWRKELVMKELSDNNCALEDLAAVVGRGGLVKPIAGGVYEVNDTLYEDTRNAHREHACNLGALIARSIARKAGDDVKSYIVDPVVVDEMEDVARISGHPLFPRMSMFHALNARATALRYAKESGRAYDDLNLVVAHMGGGISVSVHKQGRIVDTTNAISGDGCFSPERAGRVEPMALAEACFSGDYTLDEIQRELIGGGGLVAHLGVNSMYDVVQASLAGDEKAAMIVEAFCYNIAKDIAAMSSVLRGDVDAILVTGGIAYSDVISQKITDMVEWITTVVVYPGENELEALAGSVRDVINGNQVAKIYV